MATPSSQTLPPGSGKLDSTSSLPAELLEKQLQALERFQILLRAIHTQYTSVFEDIMEATNGEIVQYVPILPSVIRERTKDLFQMDFRIQGYTIFSGFEHTRLLITNGIDTVRRGLKDFYTVGDALLIEKAKGAEWTQNILAKPLEKFMGSKKTNQDQLAGIEKDIASWEAEVILLKVELDMTVNSYWNSKGAGEVEGHKVSSARLSP
jgi:hypothetical protein